VSNYYVFRIAKGHDGGVLKGSCPLDFKNKKKEIESLLLNIDEEIIEYNSCMYKWLHQQLWQCGKLRQGWGIEGLDLRIVGKNEENLSEWIENYIIGAKKYWGSEITKDYCEIATGRFNILKVLLEMKYGDYIFIPTHSQAKHYDSNKFTLCKVLGDYFFDLDEDIKDFGHVIPVKIIGDFFYNETNLETIDFTGFYSKAVSKIEKHHKLYKKVVNFIKNIK